MSSKLPALPLELTSTSTGHALLSLSSVHETPAATPNAQVEVLRLFDECAPDLRRYVRSCGLAPDAAEDVVQEAFLALFRHLCLGGSRSNLRGWLVQVCFRSALKHRERQARRDRRETTWDPALVDGAIDPAADPETRLSDDQRQRRLRAVVRALPERDRQCLSLRAEGLPYRDIARTLGVSLGTVAKSLARAAARLSNAMRT
jgi:RNA polymerase sigma-70 factor (ECF subfamily)